MLVKISYGNKGTVNTGNYENVNPQYFLSVEIEKNKVSEKEIEKELKRIKLIVDENLLKDIDTIKNPKPQASCPLRTETIGGEKFIHVTSAITPERPDVPHIEEHAALGSCLDNLCKNYIETGKAEPTCEIPQTPNIKQTWESLKEKTLQWLSDNKDDIVFSGHSINGLNSVYRFIGELDAIGTYKGAPAIFDFKKTRTVSSELKDKYFQQMAAYSLFDNMTDGFAAPEALVICSPFNKPIVTDEVARYQLTFLNTLKTTRERYGV